MTEIEQLILEVQAKGLADVNKRLDELNVKSAKASSDFANMGFKIAGLAVAGAGLLKIGKLLVDATKSYQDLNAQLITATQSQKNATQATEAINDLAQKTPYDVKQVTDAFISLVNLGLDPSEKAIISYGNTASAMSKDLSQFVQAVAQATNGEFRDLREFGIKASAEGNKVSFMFRGQRTEVANTTKAIEGYLQGLGNKQFAGAMEERMKTLGGALSNLGDAWDQLWINISKQGPDAAITKAVALAGDALTELNDQLKSGEFEANLQAYKLLWAGTFTDIQTSLKATSSTLDESAKYWSSILGVEKDDLVNFFKYFPIEARVGVQGLTLEFIKWEHDLEAIFDAAVESVKNDFNEMVEAAKTTGSAMNRALHGDFSGDYLGDLKKVHKAHDDMAATITKHSNDQIDQNQELFNQTMASLGTEMAGQENAIELEKEKGRVKRQQYDDAQEARKAAGQDRLAQFKTGTDDTGPSPEDIKKARELELKIFEERIKTTEEGLTREGQVIDTAYEERKKRILENTALTEEEKKNLILAQLSSAVVSEEQGIKDSYDRRKEFILSATGLTEAQKTALMTNLTKAREESIRKIEQDNLNKRLDQASSFFGNIASIGSTFGKKGFKIAQAAAIAQATIDTYKAATGAYSSLASIPYVGPALGIAAAAAAVVAGAANIAKIKSQTYQGAYEYGGMISAGRYGLVGEAGPEFVKGPAIVTSAATTAANARSGGQANGVKTVTVANWGAPVQAESSQNGDQLLITLRPLLEKNKADTKREIASDITRGGGNVSQKLEQTYGLRRANAS